MLGQSPAPNPETGQPGDKPAPPPADQPEPNPPQGEPDGEEAPAKQEPEQDDQPDEKAYAALTVEGPVDEAALGAFKKLALEAKLPVDKAQALLDLHGRMQAEARSRFDAELAAEFLAWRKAAEADPFLSGGDVPNGGFRSIKDAVASAGQFLDRYGDPELREILNGSALGNHPAMLRALARAGRDVASDRLVPGRGGQRIDPLKAMFPTMGPEYFEH